MARQAERVRVVRALFAVALVTLVGATVSRAATGARLGGETVRHGASIRISAGGAHTCQVNEDGSVRCWGRNIVGQLGNGTTTAQPAPVAVSGIFTAVGVAAGGDIDFAGGFACAVLANGTARCWGANANGQLGDGTRVGRVTSVGVSGLTDAVAITAGGGHACSLHSTGKVRCWGENGQGQLGDGTTADRLTSVLVIGVSNAVAVDAGETHTCALLADGTVRCWGSNSLGELGDGTSGNRRLTAVAVSGLSRVASISAGYYHTCAVLAGTVRCWGWNRFGALGDGNVDVHSVTPVLTRDVRNAVTIAAGWLTTCASLADGTARCWGLGDAGQLGDGRFPVWENPVPVTVKGMGAAVAITTGGVHTCALLVAGAAACWGGNAHNQLGRDISIPITALPVEVPGGAGGFSARDVAAGRNHTCAVRANGRVACWGENAFGQIGDGSSGVDRLTPVTVPGLIGVTAVAAGDAHTCALLVGGTVRCWGLNSSGQLGDGTTSTRTAPVPVSGLTNVAAIAAGGGIGGSHTCALLANGTLRCWGANGNGQIGDGATSNQLLPVSIRGVSMVAIAAGELHTCALQSTGLVTCWGGNSSGQLGDGTFANHFIAKPVAGMGYAVALSAGNLHTCALLGNGGTWCWGENLLGQLGDGSTTPRALPVPVVGGLIANVTVAIATGFGHTCAVLFNGGARCWGDNTDGQLGNATTTASTAPVVVENVRYLGAFGIVRLPLTGAVQIVSGRRHTCALQSSGGVVCWGDNSSGQLGIGSLTNALSPAAVPSFANALSLTAAPSVTIVRAPE